MLAVKLVDTASPEQLQKIYDGLTHTKLALTSLRIDLTSYGSYITIDILNALPKSLKSR